MLSCVVPFFGGCVSDADKKAIASSSCSEVNPKFTGLLKEGLDPCRSVCDYLCVLVLGA